MVSWNGTYYNPNERGWHRISNPTSFTNTSVEELDGNGEVFDAELIDPESEQVFGELATLSEFEANVLEAFEEIGLPQSDPTFDELVNEMLEDLPE